MIQYNSTGFHLEKLPRGGQNLNPENFGGVMYRVGVVCTAIVYGGLGACSPRDFLGVRLSEVISGAFSDHNDVTV